MSDFINKAKPENDFNNGGSTLGTPGGGTAGPQTQLSNQNQEGVEASLEATADTAKTSQSGSGNNVLRAASNQNTSPNCPPDYPKNSSGCCGSQTRATLFIDSAIAPVLAVDSDEYKALPGDIQQQARFWGTASGGGAEWLIQHLILYGFEGRCGCWVPLIGLSDIFGGWLAGFMLNRLMKVWGQAGKFRNKFLKAVMDRYARLPTNKGALSVPSIDNFFNKALGKSNLRLIDINGGADLKNIIINNRNQGLINVHKRAIAQLDSTLDTLRKGRSIKTVTGDTITKGSAEYTGLIRQLESLKQQTLKARERFVDEAWKVSEEALMKRSPSLPAWFNIDGFSNSALFQTIGLGINQLLALTVYRPKICFGPGSVLNENTCECECLPEYESCGFFAKDYIQIGGHSYAWVYDLVSPNFLPTADELAHCAKSCDCNLQLSSTNFNIDCKCTDCVSGFTWKDGNGCACLRDYYYTPPPGQRKSDRGGWKKQRGICIDSDIVSAEEGFGKNWNEETCAYECPIGTDVRFKFVPYDALPGGIFVSRPCGAYARIEDNLGIQAPTKAHYLYTTGCDCVCDGRDQLADGTLSQFPPDCESLIGPGAVFVDDPTVCNCLPCPDEDKTCVKEMSYGVAFNVTEEQCNQGDPWWGIGSFTSYNDGTNNGDCGYPGPISYVNPGVSIAAIGRPPDDYGYLSATDAVYTKDGSCSGSCADGTCGSDDPTQEDFYCSCICNVFLDQLP